MKCDYIDGIVVFGITEFSLCSFALVEPPGQSKDLEKYSTKKQGILIWKDFELCSRW